jgi:hypothetical protein
VPAQANTFEAYCQERWGWDRWNADHIIAAKITGAFLESRDSKTDGIPVARDRVNANHIIAAKATSAFLTTGVVKTDGSGAHGPQNDQ